MLRERRRHAHYKLNSRLDRKSSRGMIYENEELRLRTININAEVEKGQSDIKRLRRENEQLRREIWTLRDECDRLNKRFKTKLAEYEKSDCSARGSSGNTSVSFWCDGRDISGIQRCNEDQGQSDDSDSCETCKMMENCQEDNCPAIDAHQVSETINMTSLPPAFDHLSIVSEETLSNVAETHRNVPLTPTTPLEKFTNELIDSQAIIPPLSYFENVVHRASNTSEAYTPDASTYPTRDYGWDHNIQSPFGVHRMIITNPIAEDVTPKSPKLTTFKPKILPKPKLVNNGHIMRVNGQHVVDKPPSMSLSPSTSGKQFFSTIRGGPVVALSRSTTTTTSEEDTNYDPPDLTVTNGLATPYQRDNSDESKSSQKELSQENLESLLNDIETISGDICALKMQKNQALEQLELTKKQLMDDKQQVEGEEVKSQLLEQYKDNKKAYRSEMNLLLSFNGTNTTFLPISKQVTTDGTIVRSTSLDKYEYEQNSIPSMPDPMTLFPDNHSYLPAPNKSQLFNLAAKRDLFRNAPPSMIRSLDIKTNFDNQLTTNELMPEISMQQNADTLFLNSFPIEKTTEHNNTTSTGLTAIAASWSNIPASSTTSSSTSASAAVVDTKYLKSFSFSTPNSPHTLRRNSIKNKKGEISNDAIIMTEEQGQKEDQFDLPSLPTPPPPPAPPPSIICQDMQSPQTLSSIDIKKPQIIQKTCSRRHSDCTHLANQHAGIMRSSNGNGHCHMHRLHNNNNNNNNHHHHHHHGLPAQIHRASLVKNNNILLNTNNNSRKDSNCETGGGSFSDRNSNSFSRDSSISFNGGNTRKISISSRKGGKIPWCGCWGNGCL